MLVYVVFSRVGIYLHHKHTICNQPCLNITWPSPMAACPACCCWGEILLSLASDLDSWSGMLRCCYIWPQHLYISPAQAASHCPLVPRLVLSRLPPSWWRCWCKSRQEAEFCFGVLSWSTRWGSALTESLTSVLE